MRNPFPKKKSRLPPLGKALAAAEVVHAVADGRMDDKQAGRYLREQVGLQWTLLTAFQYLTGQEAIGALRGLPEAWVGAGGLTRVRVLEVVALANDVCANAHPRGSAMSAGLLVAHFKRSPQGDRGA